MERDSKGDVGRTIGRLTVTVEEAAVLLGISRTSAYGCASRNEIPTVRLGRRLVVPLTQLTAMLEGEAPTPAATPASTSAGDCTICATGPRPKRSDTVTTSAPWPVDWDTPTRR